MKITITLEVDPELVDSEDASGLTSEAHDEVFNDLMKIGTDITIIRGTG